jgi:type I restriction enzyme M protein
MADPKHIEEITRIFGEFAEVSVTRDTENVPLGGERGGVLQARGAAARTRCLGRPREDQGRVRDNRHFYVFKAPRALAEMDGELKVVTDRTLEMIRGLSA